MMEEEFIKLTTWYQKNEIVLSRTIGTKVAN
jgi:hypothetical protein